ncbi:MAG: Smr/MutS family protein [Stellaceae bacterium]
MAKNKTARPALPDGALWRAVMRDVVPLPGRPERALPRSLDTAPPRSGAAPQAPTPPPVPRPFAAGFVDLDRATAERLKRGMHPIEARLDLHGMTQSEAHRALVGFVADSRAAGRRCVLIITGRGLASGEPGVLKRAVPRWLDEPGLRPQVLAIAAAQPRHGGSGALYLLLRRRR